MLGSDADGRWVDRYPSLFTSRRHSWDGVSRDYTLQLTLDSPPDHLVVNVRLIATVGEDVVVCQTEDGWRMLPGGSRERGESVEETARRELLEEAGCRVVGDITWFASFTVTNPGRPWRPWHPFPVTAWPVGVVGVERVAPPTNPAGGERVVAVHTLAPLEARSYLSGFDNGGQADLVALADELGHLPTSARG